MLTLFNIKKHLRITHNSEDQLLTSLMDVGYEFAENYTGRAIKKRNETLKLDQFIDKIVLPKMQVISVVSIDYKDTQSNPASQTEYYLNLRELQATLEPLNGSEWPETDGTPENVEIIYEVGYNAIPMAIEQAVLLIIGSLYLQRENHIEVVRASKVPLSAEYLLNPYRVEL